MVGARVAARLLRIYARPAAWCNAARNVLIKIRRHRLANMAVMSGSVWINPHTGTGTCQDKHKGAENCAVQRACHLPMGCGSKRTKSALVVWCGGSLQRTYTGLEQIGTE